MLQIKIEELLEELKKERHDIAEEEKEKEEEIKKLKEMYNNLE